MPIPPLTSDGWLPPGEHACSLDEIRETYVVPFAASQTRPAIFSALSDHLHDPEVKAAAQHVLLDGSFVSSKTDPQDADLLLGLRPGGLRAALHSPRGPGLIKHLLGHFAGSAGGHYLLHVFACDVGDSRYHKFAQFFHASDRPNEPAVKGILFLSLV